MSESRGAASVTLDTIIAPLLLQLIKDWPDNESDAEFAERSARLVTDALLAKGQVTKDGIDGWYYDVFHLMLGPSS